MRLDVYGTLHAAGTLDDDVQLVADLAGSTWYGLRFLGDGDGTLGACRLRQATCGIDLRTTGSVSLVGSTIEDGGFGINAVSGQLSLINDVITGNADYGIRVTGATLQFGDDLDAWNELHHNGSGLPGRQLCNGTADLDARYVYWGSMHPADIENGLWDQLDDAGLGRVTYWPYTSAEHDYVITSAPEAGPDGALPRRTSVFQNVPNPFNPATEIRFELGEALPVRLEVFDLAGARVATLVDQPLAAGRYRTSWQGTDDHGRVLASGVYLYRFAAGEMESVRRMVLIR
jgi:hypothetical protein